MAQPDECPGSGLPTNTSGGCDRCFAGNVRGDYVRTKPERFAVFPSVGYYVAKPHAAVATLAGGAKGVG